MTLIAHARRGVVDDSSFGDKVFDALELVVGERLGCGSQEKFQARWGKQCGDDHHECDGAKEARDRKSTRLNSSHVSQSRMPSSA